MAGPLRGWRVLELGHAFAANFCGKILADLGAEVVMVEPPSGHGLRSYEPVRDDGLSGRFAYLNAGKRSVAVPETDAGDEKLRTLIGDADLFVTDAHPTRVRDLTAGADGVVVVGIRPFGRSGPYADHRAHHLTIFHAAGEGSTLPSGRAWALFPERPPIVLGSGIGYFDAGWNAAVAALAACYDVMRSGDAQRVDVSIQESLLTLSRTRLSRYVNEGVLLGREKSRYGITGMLRCADGWVECVGMREEHWDRLVVLPEGAEFRDAGFDTEAARGADTPGLGKALHAWCAARPKAEVARILVGVGAPAGIFAEAADLLASEQLAHRGFLQTVGDGRGGTITVPGAPYRLSRTPATVGDVPAVGSTGGFGARAARPSARERSGGRLLEGMRVLDFTWAAAGPYATLLLGFLGADVIKVESTRRLDPARRGFVTHYEGLDNSPIFNELGLNKRSLQVDLTQPEGLEIVQRLAATVDVVVDNFRPGVMERFGLGPDALLARHPGLVVASSSANGSTGPDAMGAGLASIFAATGGISTQTGYADGPPTEVSDTMDYRSGAALAVGILGALVHRAQTGEGQHVDLSSREVATASAPDALLAHVLGVAWEPRIGNGHRRIAPHGVYPCRHGEWVALVVANEVDWAGLCEVLGRDAWRAEYPSAGARRAAGSVIDDEITQWSSARVAREAAEVLQGAGVAAEPVMSFADIFDDEHIVARGAFVDVEHPLLGRQRVMRAPWRFSRAVDEIRRPGPIMGADNDGLLDQLDGVPEIPAERRAEVFR